MTSRSAHRMSSNHCGYDIVGRVLDDIALMEAETGSHGTLDAILRSACWSEDRKRLQALLRKVEEQRHETKRRNSKKQESAGVGPLSQWSGDCQEARGQLVTGAAGWEWRRLSDHALTLEHRSH